MPLACLKVNIAAVSARLSKEQHRYIGLVETRRWLAQNGLAQAGDNWYCDAQSADRLLPNEILTIRKLTPENGVTFVQ